MAGIFRKMRLENTVSKATNTLATAEKTGRFSLPFLARGLVDEAAPSHPTAAVGGLCAVEKRHTAPKIFASFRAKDPVSPEPRVSGILEYNRGFTLLAGAKTGQSARSATIAPSTRPSAPGEGRPS